MNSEFNQYIQAIPQLFNSLIEAKTGPIRGQKLPAEPAVYIFYVNGEPVHVGRTRNLRQRIQGHVSNSHYSASFAFKWAREITGAKASYRKGEGRGALLEKPEFATAFAKALADLGRSEMKYLIVPDPIHQYFLELYAAIELKTSLTEFDTH